MVKVNASTLMATSIMVNGNKTLLLERVHFSTQMVMFTLETGTVIKESMVI